MRGPNRRSILAALAALPMCMLAPNAYSEDANILNYKSDKAIKRLLERSPETEKLLNDARGVLIMPEITKAGFLFGGAYGEGVLRVNNQTVGYYAVTEGSFGLQAGAQRTSQALLFMTTGALEKFRRSDGWELGAAAEVTVPKDGLNTNITTTTAQNPVISFTFSETGLMAGVSLEGGKYSKLQR